MLRHFDGRINGSSLSLKLTFSLMHASSPLSWLSDLARRRLCLKDRKLPHFDRKQPRELATVKDDEASLLQSQREAEMMIIEAYTALLLAFLSTESTTVKDAIARCLPNQRLQILVPVLERFVAFHLTLNMISPETHTAVVKVIESCKKS